MNEVRKGKTVVLEGQPYVVVSADFLKKQQRRPVVRAVLRHLKTGQNREHTFMQSDKIVEADISRRPYQYLYRDGQNYIFMRMDNYDQVSLDEAMVGEAARWLAEGQEAEVLEFEDKPVVVELPIKIQRKVVSAPPGIKGDTSTNVMKEVELEGGAKAKAPLFIKEGDTIVIDTRTGDYVERG